MSVVFSASFIWWGAKEHERRMRGTIPPALIFARRIPVTMKAAEMACDAGDVAKAY
jgi:hypothetical protein